MSTFPVIDVITVYLVHFVYLVAGNILQRSCPDKTTRGLKKLNLQYGTLLFDGICITHFEICTEETLF